MLVTAGTNETKQIAILPCTLTRDTEQFHFRHTFRHAIQPAEDQHRSRTRPDKPRWQGAKMARIGREGTFRRGINRFQSAAWWQPLRRRQKLWRRGGCAP